MSNEPLLLIPGLNCTGELFRDQIQVFSPARMCRVAPHGDFADLRPIAGAILHLAPPTFALAGLSMGGYVAMEIMRQAPQRVTRLALLNTRATPDSPEELDRRLALIQRAESGDFDSIHDTLWPKLVDPARTGDKALEDVVRGMAKTTGPDRFVRQQRAIISRPNYRMTLEAIRCPTLVLVGEQDQITPVEQAKILSTAVRGSRLVVTPNCGHLSALEQPHAVNTAMLLWLQQKM